MATAAPGPNSSSVTAASIRAEAIVVDRRNTGHIEILASKEDRTVEMAIHQPLPRVPAWIRMRIHGERPQFWTLPPGHYLERTEGRYGCPRQMVATGHRYLSDQIDQATAEAQFAEALAAWSRATA